MYTLKYKTRSIAPGSSRGASHGGGGRKFSRPNFKSSGRPPQRGGGGRGGKRGKYIDEKLFINKAVKAEREVYVPKHTFADFGFSEGLLKNLVIKNYINPSPIQDQTIALGLEGKDVIGIANTGTGKTAAFLLPIINKLLTDKKASAMVLAPTRELAQQIEKEFKSFTTGMRLYSVTCVGGAPMGKQVRELNMGVHIVIGTPGRVKDLINRGNIKPAMFGMVVLDEADRMLDMGFVDDMRYILGKMPKDRQGFFFSATFSPEIKTLCTDFLNAPVTVSVKTRDTSQNIDQNVVRASGKDQKIEALHDILNKPDAKKVLIFREMKRHVDDLAKELNVRGFKVLALHGDMRNRERERAVYALAHGTIQALIATDVAARGIDIPDITHVINYDIPQDYDTYIHRIGRTGRGDKAGTALTFI